MYMHVPMTSHCRAMMLVELAASMSGCMLYVWARIDSSHFQLMCIYMLQISGASGMSRARLGQLQEQRSEKEPSEDRKHLCSEPSSCGSSDRVPSRPSMPSSKRGSLLRR